MTMVAGSRLVRPPSTGMFCGAGNKWGGASHTALVMARTYAAHLQTKKGALLKEVELQLLLIVSIDLQLCNAEAPLLAVHLGSTQRRVASLARLDKKAHRASHEGGLGGVQQEANRLGNVLRGKRKGIKRGHRVNKVGLLRFKKQLCH